MSRPVKHILYVDDDPIFIRLVQRGLGRRGYNLEGATTIEQAMERLNGPGIDAIALDHYLGSGTGMEFLRGLRHPHPPVIYVTASAEVSVAVDALKAGAFDYVPKTVGEEFLELLDRSLQQAIERARLEQEKALADQAIREAKDRAEILLHEVNHRTANSLMLVTALLRMQHNVIEDPAAKAALAQMQRRIDAIAGIHRRLYTSDDVTRVELREYLEGLIDEFRATLDRSALDLVLEAPQPISISTDKAVSIGMVVTELVTNSIKYAYPSGAGQVRVALKPTSHMEIELSVEDDGVGPQHAAGGGTGVGRRIISAMARGLSATLTNGTGPGYQTKVIIPLE